MAAAGGPAAPFCLRLSPEPFLLQMSCPGPARSAARRDGQMCRYFV